MSTRKRSTATGLLPLIIVLIAMTGVSCQYDYYSPQPGIIEVRLRSISNNIDFTPLNNFVIKVTSVEAVRGDGSKVIIYEDLKAIERKTSVYNTLDVRARDSLLVIGSGYVPPGEYMGANLVIDPGDDVILNGYQVIDVVRPEGFSSQLAFRDRSFDVREMQTTQINLTLDLDSSLVRGALVYYFRPYYYISYIR